MCMALQCVHVLEGDREGSIRFRVCCCSTAVELQGFVVLALEHADGTAATVQLAGRAGHKFYSGWLSEEERLDQTRCILMDPASKFSGQT